ncbi:NADPH dehydrogenase [[Clostridium] ultunense Esp]|nr:NADPH dehydrogenase [[Clostridium] ultunense Esp]
MSLLFTPFTIRNVTLKNRIVMSPMCMYSCYAKDGKVTPFHITHYVSRAVGQVGLIVQEATAVLPEGRISEEDLGIWEEDQLPGLTQLVEEIHRYGAKAGIQLAHAGRKAEVRGTIYAPSAIRFNERYAVPEALTLEGIQKVIDAFRAGAERAKRVGYDVIEIHAAHGYLLNQFLSPLANRREDEYGGSAENRFRLLGEVITAVRDVWQGPLFVRVSADEYHEKGNRVKDWVRFSGWMKEKGVDLIDVSSGGVIPGNEAEPIPLGPGYQVPYAREIREKGEIPTGAVGLITSGRQAEEILEQGEADLIFIARELLRDPYFPRRAALELGESIEAPVQYRRGWNF